MGVKYVHTNFGKLSQRRCWGPANVNVEMSKDEGVADPAKIPGVNCHNNVRIAPLASLHCANEHVDSDTMSDAQSVHEDAPK